ncbi:MAG: ATP-grasp domain-containing protein [Chloroflexi bacterium]|nr:ATP-grasp domain-containing protein [Chloroflexota bacterium]
MKKLNILVPSAGHPTRPSLLKCLQNNGERQIRIVGMDMETNGIASHIVDKFYHVPPRSDPEYLDLVLDICSKESIDVYYALGEEEAIAAVQRKNEFNTVGTAIISPGTPEMVTIATNKCRWHDYLASRGIAHADYRNIYVVNEIEEAIHSLGYPYHDVFVKPAIAKGGRGARIITSKNLSEEYYTDRSGEPKMSLNAFIELLSPFKDSGKFLPILAMEYLPGTYYSVDVLSENGKPHYVIPKIRIQGTASNTTVGQVSLDSAVIELATDICRVFDFSYLQNYEMKVNNKGEIIPYDINPRGGASVALCAGAGANIAYYAVKMAIGEEIPQKKVINGTKMIRYYDEFYTNA